MLSREERVDIAAYKAAAAKLPPQQHLADYALPDYTETVYNAPDNFDSLALYLQEAREYTRLLQNAAALRERHYERHIRNRRAEELGHSIWRRGLSLLAQDALQKVDAWAAVSSELFAELVTNSVPAEIEIADAEYSYLPEVPVERPSCAMPKLSAAEKRRRKNRRAKARKRRLREEQALIQQFALPAVGSVEFSTISNILSLTQSPMPMLHVHPVWLFHSEIQIAATLEEKRQAAEHIVSRISKSETPDIFLLSFILCRDKEFRDALYALSDAAKNYILAAAIWLSSSPADRRTMRMDRSTPRTVEDVLCMGIAMDMAEYAMTHTFRHNNAVRNAPTITYLLGCVQQYYSNFEKQLVALQKKPAVRRRFGSSVLPCFSDMLESIRAVIIGSRIPLRDFSLTQKLTDRSHRRGTRQANLYSEMSLEETRQAIVDSFVASLAGGSGALDLSKSASLQNSTLQWRDRVLVLYLLPDGESGGAVAEATSSPTHKILFYDCSECDGVANWTVADIMEKGTLYVYDMPSWA